MSVNTRRQKKNGKSKVKNRLHKFIITLKYVFEFLQLLYAIYEIIHK